MDEAAHTSEFASFMGEIIYMPDVQNETYSIVIRDHNTRESIKLTVDSSTVLQRGVTPGLGIGVVAFFDAAGIDMNDEHRNAHALALTHILYGTGVGIGYFDTNWNYMGGTVNDLSPFSLVINDRTRITKGNTPYEGELAGRPLLVMFSGMSAIANWTDDTDTRYTVAVEIVVLP